MEKRIINVILYCIFLTVSFLRNVQADEYPGEVWMRCNFSFDERKLSPGEKTAASRYKRYIMFKSFLNSHRILDKDGLKELTEHNFQNDDVAFLTTIDTYKHIPPYPKDSLELSLVFKFGAMPRYTFLENLNDKLSPNFKLDKNGAPRISNYFFRYPFPAQEKDKNTIKKDSEYFMLQFQLHESKSGLDNIPANFEYMDNKAHSDKLIGLCSFIPLEQTEQITAPITMDEKE